eukprot:TRINITY_DN8036_c0_g1_i1.p1 TRINITY_DN8036_c0_g1~~TRINITY_DN8036_c0_g1_i1.p1  ORF type:complete len:164 (+),score=6.79 TRINITY_DN8036_c0_g1_i1:130-621(+)
MCIRDRFIAILREIAILAYCDHPYIIPIKGTYFHKERLTISILLPRYYQDLYSLIFGPNKTKIPEKIQICCQLLEALDYIHKAGMIHLDLKLSNIMFTTPSLNKIALLDFGISKIPKNQENSANILGISYFYCPPEINLSGKSNISAKSDIFSLGIILYEFFH